jgi:hypothetical protein
VGILDLYRSPKPQSDSTSIGTDADEAEEPEPLPPLSLSEFWPISPRVKLLLIGLGFFLLNLILLGVFAYVWVAHN